MASVSATAELARTGGKKPLYTVLLRARSDASPQFLSDASAL
jgi:hypothetical protein